MTSGQSLKMKEKIKVNRKPKGKYVEELIWILIIENIC